MQFFLAMLFKLCLFMLWMCGQTIINDKVIFIYGNDKIIFVRAFLLIFRPKCVFIIRNVYKNQVMSKRWQPWLELLLPLILFRHSFKILPNFSIFNETNNNNVLPNIFLDQFSDFFTVFQKNFEHKLFLHLSYW